LAGYGILTVLGLIAIGLLLQQYRFNPAVSLTRRAPLLPGRLQAVAAPELAVTAALLPEAASFTPLAAIERFGPENLSDKIDGKAELYLAAGFKAMSCRSFAVTAAGGARMEAFLYDMGSPPHAFAVFSGQRRPGSPSLPLTANAYATTNALFFTQGRFYVELVADRASEALLPALETYARALLAKLPAAGQTQEASALFPPEGLALDTVRLSAADTFGLEGLNNVFTGEYRLSDGTATAFIAARATPAEARAEAKRYLDFLAANGYQKVSAPGAPQDMPLLVLDNTFEIVLVQGRNLAGVHDASSQAAALELAGKLRTALQGKP